MTKKRIRRQNTRLRFERWAANPTCKANIAAVVHNVSMVSVARHENPSIHVKEQSQLAFERGLVFEASLLRDGAERLIAELQRTDAIPSNSYVGFVDLRIQSTGAQPRDFDAAHAASTKWLQDVASLKPGFYLVAGLAIRIPRGVMLPEASLILDVLLVDARESKKELIVGEVKSYSDRGGYTKAASLASARAQAGLYVHALSLVVESLAITEECVVSQSGFLVLAKPGRNFPTVRWNEDFRWQAERARRGFGLLEQSALDLNGEFAFDENLPDQQLLDLILHAETDFGDACIGFCERAPTCQRLSLIADDGAFLGDEMKRFLNDVPLSRAEELLNGSRPKSGKERDLVERMKASAPRFSSTNGETS
jgi:hypothetical protein